MEITISADTIIKLATVLTACGVIGGVVLWESSSLNETNSKTKN